MWADSSDGLCTLTAVLYLQGINAGPQVGHAHDLGGVDEDICGFQLEGPDVAARTLRSRYAPLVGGDRVTLCVDAVS